MTYRIHDDINDVEPIEPFNDEDNENSVDSNIGDDTSHDCCAPDQFSTKFKHTIPKIGYSAQGTIYYDNTMQAMRYDLVVGDGSGTSIYDGNFTMISNFTSGIEWYYNVNDNSCAGYGLDLWNEWCFGSSYNQSETLLNGEISCFNTMNSDIKNCTQWVNDEMFFQSYTTQALKGACLPASTVRTTGEQWLYYDAKVGSWPSSLLNVNSACSETTTFIRCNNNTIKT